MESLTSNDAGPSEVTILARVLGNKQGQLSTTMARHFLNLGFGARDKARMHELAVRNQADGLSPSERRSNLLTPRPAP